MKSVTRVLIGRFQLPHNGHLALLRAALAQGTGPVVVVLGSSFGARSPKNPFTWEERAAMLKLCLTSEESGRVRFAAVRDYYNDSAWVRAVKQAVASVAEPESPVVLVGHDKDATSYYLQNFEEWGFEDLGNQGALSSTPLRHALLSGSSVPAIRAVLEPQVPEAVLDFLQAWSNLPYLADLVRERAKIQAERALWANAPYEPIFVTVDAVVSCADHILLVQRAGELGRGLWALPGGFLDPEERILQSAIRELKEETQIGLRDEDLVRSLKDRSFFDHPQRSLRGRTITFAHHFDLGMSRLPQVQGADDAKLAKWVPIADLPAYEAKLFEDHFVILSHFFSKESGLWPHAA